VGRGFVDVDGFDPATSSKWDLIFWSKRVDAPSIAIVQFSVAFRVLEITMAKSDSLVHQLLTMEELLSV
jgi:hypothetical protein